MSYILFCALTDMDRRTASSASSSVVSAAECLLPAEQNHLQLHPSWRWWLSCWVPNLDRKEGPSACPGERWHLQQGLAQAQAQVGGHQLADRHHCDEVLAAPEHPRRQAHFQSHFQIVMSGSPH